MKPKYFIRSKGKAEFKTFHLINIETFDMLDSFFNSEIEAIEFANKKSFEIVEYKEYLVEKIVDSLNQSPKNTLSEDELKECVKWIDDAQDQIECEWGWKRDYPSFYDRLKSSTS